MRLLVVGAESEYAIERFYLKYWMAFDKIIDLEFFAAQNLFYDFYNKSIINKVVFKFGLSRIYSQINRKLIRRIDDFNPDYIFVFKGMEIFSSTLIYAKNKKIKLINYNPDSPFVFSGKGSGNSNITNSIDLYDFHFSYDHEISKTLINNHFAKVEILPFGFEISQGLFEICLKEPEILKVCFIGTPDNERVNFINLLAENGVFIDVFGSNWNRFVTHTNIQIFDAVYGIELWKTLRRYRVQLNLMRPHNLDSHNMRSFEIPGIGGIQLAPNTADHRSFFEDGKSIFLFNSVEESLAKITFLLSLTTQNSIEIRRFSRQTCLDKKYTYYDRANQVINFLLDL